MKPIIYFQYGFTMNRIRADGLFSVDADDQSLVACMRLNSLESSGNRTLPVIIVRLKAKQTDTARRVEVLRRLGQSSREMI